MRKQESSERGTATKQKRGTARGTGRPIACFLPVPVKSFIQASRVEPWKETFNLRYPKGTLGLLINA